MGKTLPAGAELCDMHCYFLLIDNLLQIFNNIENNSKFKQIFLQDLFYFGNPNKGILKTL